MEPRQNSGSAPSSRSSNSEERRPGFHVLTLFPEVCESVLSSSLIGKAREKGLVSFQTYQIRDFTTDKHRTVDDTPYGGGEGMLLKVDVLHSAWQQAHDRALEAAGGSADQVLTILLSPQGASFDQSMAKELADRSSQIILVCGHYEGVDERFIELCVDREVSIGDFVLTGGELPAMVIADAVTRLIPGVVGNEQSVAQDSFENDLLKYPQYTRPREFLGHAVPDVLLSGDHGAIEAWRDRQRRDRTARKRPDLLKK